MARRSRIWLQVSILGQKNIALSFVAHTVASAKRLADFPNVPTVSETIPDFSATGWGVLVAPLNTPQAIIQKVSADLSQVTSQSDLQKNLAELGSYTRTMTPAETTAFVHQQQNIWNPVLADIDQKQQK